MNLPHYRRMLADRARVRAFRGAIRAAVRPGDVVVEIGAGLGTYSLFAAAAGARRVYAIEADPEVCRLAECIAEQNGLADRIRFLRGYSSDVELPERADVAIYEDYSSFFFSTGLPRLLRDIRTRLLRPGGRLIPGAVDLYVAAVESARIHRQLDLLAGRGDRVGGFDFSETRRLVMNRPAGAAVPARGLLTAPRRCARIRLGGGRDPGFVFQAACRARRDGRIHGVAGWMDLELAPGRRLSCSPLRAPTAWSQNFFPFAEPLRVRRGARVDLSMELIFPPGVSTFHQRWSAGAAAGRREGNTFAGAAFSTGSLTGESAATRARLGVRGRMLLTLLAGLQEEAPYGRVAATLVRKHPGLFKNTEDALATIVRAVPALSSVAGDF